MQWRVFCFCSDESLNGVRRTAVVEEKWLLCSRFGG